MIKLLCIITTCIMVIGCSNTSSDEPRLVGKVVTVNISDRVLIGFDSIRYTGIVNDHVFSIAATPGAGDNRSDVNVYYPLDFSEIKVNNVVYEVQNVTADRLVLKVLRIED